MARRQCIVLAALAATLWACGTDVITASPLPFVDGADGMDNMDVNPADGVSADVGKACLTDFDCSHPGVAAGCDEPLCKAGLCANIPTEMGVPCEVSGWIGGVCEQQACDGAGLCLQVAVADGTGCGDMACGEICQSGKCKAGASADDGNPCTTDTCNKGVIYHKPVDNPAVTCDDGDPCTQGDACAYGKCGGGTANCNDGVACTIDFCDAKVGCVSLPSLPMCEDGDPCTLHICDAKDGCKAAAAAAGKACDDGNPCTAGDGCSKAGVCVGGSNSCNCEADGDCKADNPCLKLACQAGKCVADPDQAVVCADVDGGPCSKAACDAKTGKCALQPVNEGKACGDDDPCTKANACTAGQCKAKTLLKCDDGNGCTVDICSAGVGCVHKGSEGPCDDSNACTEGDVCQTGVCAGAWKSCNDSDDCTVDKCDAKTGACQHAKIANCGNACANDAACADGDPCTDDKCMDDGSCQHAKKPDCPKPGCKDASGCDDNNACTFDMCLDSKCQYQALGCNDANSCTKDSCNPKTGGCQFDKIPGCGAGCQSHADCAGADKCSPSYCVAKACKAYPKNCNDYDDCSKDSCNPKTGACLFTPIPGCVSVKCKSNANCDDKKVCTNDYCQLQTGKCYNTNIPNCDPTKPKCKSNKDCEDNKPCTYDYCNTYYGTCSNNAIPNCDPTKPKCKSAADCDDGKPCTNDTCHPAYGTCYNTQVVGCTTGNPCKESSQCTDNNKCTSNLCIQGSCAAKAISCDDYNPCTKDSCQSYTGNCYHQAVPGCVATKCAKDADCDDQNKCTKDTCEVGWCKYVKQPDCASNPGG